MHTYFYISKAGCSGDQDPMQEKNDVSCIPGHCSSVIRNNINIAQDRGMKNDSIYCRAEHEKKENNAKTSKTNNRQLNKEFGLFGTALRMICSPKENKCAVHSTLCPKKYNPGLTAYSSKNRGSATLEAVCVIPIMFIAFLAFYMIGQIYIMDNQIYQAARNVADELAEYAYISDYMSEDSGGTAEDVLGIGLANAGIQRELQNNTRVDRYIKGGRHGVYALSLNLLDEEGFITFDLHYRIQIQLPFLKTMSTHIRIPVRQKAYIGYIPKGEEVNEDDIYVYVTEHGSVYHMTKGCRHLKVTIHPVSGIALKRDYSKLPPCEYCGKHKADVYYISEYGDCYHSSSDCSGLKRTIRRVRLRDVNGLPPCSSCGGS